MGSTLREMETPRFLGRWNGVVLPLRLPIVVEPWELPAPDEWGRLSRRERDVLWGVASGDSNARIAARLGISESRVRGCLHATRVALGIYGRPTRPMLALWVWSLFGDPAASPVHAD